MAILSWLGALFGPRTVEVPGQPQDADVHLLSLGGDHFITWPLLKAHAEKYGPLALVQFDAHQDTWDDEGGRIDHGTFVTTDDAGFVVTDFAGLMDTADDVALLPDGRILVSTMNGDIDVIMAGYVPDASIEGVIWSNGYLDFGLCMIVNESMSSTFRSPAQLQ